MAGLLEASAFLLVVAMVLKIMLAAMLGGLYEWRSWHFLMRHLRRNPAPVPTTRPLEEIAADARRIAACYHQQGMRFAQYEGRRQSFDRILAEAADVLQIDHLLDVLPPGDELDVERDRIEVRLVQMGVLLRQPSGP